MRYPRGGFEFALRLDGVQVLDEQFRPLKTDVSYSGRYVRIKAWVPGAINTTKTVTVVYRVRRGLFNVDDHEELYWNVTGDEWDVPIRQAEAVVIGPPAAVTDDARAIAYTGSRGIAGTDYVEQRDGNVLTFRTTRPLRPREGLTIAVAWPPGAVGRPAAWRSAVWFLQDNWPLGLPLLALALGLFAWRSYGRDPATNRSIKPEYAPPDDLAPAEAGVLVSERAHPSDVVATIVDLAVRGYMRIEPVTRADDEPDFLLPPPQAHPGRSRDPAVRAVRARQALRHGLAPGPAAPLRGPPRLRQCLPAHPGRDVPDHGEAPALSHVAGQCPAHLARPGAGDPGRGGDRRTRCRRRGRDTGAARSRLGSR